MRSFFFVMSVFAHNGVDHGAKTPATSPVAVAPPVTPPDVKSPATVLSPTELPAAVTPIVSAVKTPTTDTKAEYVASSASQNLLTFVGISTFMSIF